MEKCIIKDTWEQYRLYLEFNEYSENTVNKYMKDMKRFLIFLENKDCFDKYTVIEYKKYLISQYKISSVNSYIISLNKYFGWQNKNDLKVKTERVQRKISLDKVITKEEYQKILLYLQEKEKPRDYLLIKTLAMTGIRVGEIQFITFEAVLSGEASINNKGKRRIVYIADKLSALLLDYCKSQGIDSGIIFFGKNKNTQLDTSGIWKRMKRIAKEAKVPMEVVYPHSFRHYFAKTYMEKVGNIVELADLLGHSSIEMTRIYTLTSSKEKRKMLNLMDE